MSKNYLGLIKHTHTHTHTANDNSYVKLDARATIRLVSASLTKAAHCFQYVLLSFLII